MLTRRALIAAACAAPLSARIPTRKGVVRPLFRSPDGRPNGLEASPEGLWVGEQSTDRAWLLDWKTGKPLRKVETESSNTSGIAFGGGYLWMASNGKALGRLARPRDSASGRIIKVDPEDGRTVGRYAIPDGGGVHGVLYVDDTLWITCFKWNALARVDAATFEVKHKIPLHLGRAHGLAWDPPGIWVSHTDDCIVQKLDSRDGRVLEQIVLEKKDNFEPHGLEIRDGVLYTCDAGIVPPGMDSGSATSGFICRIDPA